MIINYCKVSLCCNQLIINIMKTRNLTFIFLLTSLFFLASCSNNDDSDSNLESNLLIGIWKPIKAVDVCSSGSQEVYNYSLCEQNGRLTINAGGSFSESSYYEYSSTNCTEEFSYNGTWKIANDDFSVIVEGDTIYITFFEVFENTLRLGMYEIDPEYTCDGDNLPSHYYTEYTRI